MKSLTTDNLDFSYTDGQATLRFTGKLQADTFDSLRDAFDALNASDPDTTVLLVINRDNFESLTGASKAFRQFCDLLRRVPNLERCAVVSDSDFLKNSAKVEGATLPGLTLMTFAPEGRDAAETGLRGERLTDDTPASPTNDNESSADGDAAGWGNLNMKKVKAAL